MDATAEAQLISAFGPARSTVQSTPLETGELERMQAYWNATLCLVRRARPPPTTTGIPG